MELQILAIMYQHDLIFKNSNGIYLMTKMYQ